MDEGVWQVGFKFYKSKNQTQIPYGNDNKRPFGITTKTNSKTRVLTGASELSVQRPSALLVVIPEGNLRLRLLDPLLSFRSAATILLFSICIFSNQALKLGRT